MISKLYGKNINFLIGSGASVGGLPTLETEYNECDKKLSVEQLLLKYKNNQGYQNIIYSYYYHQLLKKCFLDGMKKDEPVFKNYINFMEEIVKFLQRENYQKERRVNIFTTNYDLYFEKSADELIGKYDFFFNDGSAGNIAKKLSMKNFHKKIIHTGAFDSFDREIPIINLFKMHGSVSWTCIEDKNEIEVFYLNNKNDITCNEVNKINNDTFPNLDNNLADYDGAKKSIRDSFVLVFPEKDKFEKTLYQEFYYQYLRQLSYELEKNNSILIVFGFSFADEHIAEIVKRALNNPHLQIYVFCYNEEAKNKIKEKLAISTPSSKIIFISPNPTEKEIDFSIFIERLFSKEAKIESDSDE